jgi:hypothetical protein
VKLQIWRPDKTSLILDSSPSGEEEELNLFQNPVANPADLNAVMLRERLQDMSERITFADRAFLITLIWVIFLIVVVAAQMILSLWGKGLTNGQFITVVTTTTTSVFGFWYLVGQYLFPKYSNPRHAIHGPKSGKVKDTEADGDD